MQSRDLPDSIALLNRKCPHLGLFEDKTTWSSTDQVQNYCHLLKKPEQITWEHQSGYCFRDEYLACPVLLHFQNKGQSRFGLMKPTLLKVALATLLILGLVSAAVWYGNNRLKVMPAAIAVTPTNTLLAVSAKSTPTSTRLLPIPSLTPEVVSLPSATRTVTQTKTSRPTATSSPTIYLSPTRGPGLMTPFGTDPKYLVHNVTPGDNLAYLAIEYETTEEVLRVVNGLKLGDVLWVDVHLVILPGVKDTAGLQPLKAAYVDRQVSVQDLADQYKIDVALLRSLNSLGNDEKIPAKRWFVIPAAP